MTLHEAIKKLVAQFGESITNSMQQKLVLL